MIKLALPTGELRKPVAGFLDSVGLNVEGYGEGSRQYLLKSPSHSDVAVRVFRERDIPVQVALGNYDAGVTSVAWVHEMQARFPSQPLIAVADLGIASGAVYACEADGSDALSYAGCIRIASEFPNIATRMALSMRIPRFRVQGVWGAAEAYPPEDADVVVINAPDEAAVRMHGLTVVHKLLDSSAWLIVNAASIARKDISSVLSAVKANVVSPAGDKLNLPGPVNRASKANGVRARTSLRLAVPDGHQQRHVVEALSAAGMAFGGYGNGENVRRPVSGIDGLEVKVIRPQDMAQLVALGEFDLAITGRDCLNEHLFAFPSSPVEEVVDLRRGQYNLSAVVSEDLPAGTLDEAMTLWRREGKDAVVIAAEFPATADHYARLRHFWRYRVIPIAGASEGFVPEDADMLIEGTETGRTIAENRLKVIDNIYRSTTCVIAHRGETLDDWRRRLREDFISRLRRSVES